MCVLLAASLAKVLRKDPKTNFKTATSSILIICMVTYRRPSLGGWRAPPACPGKRGVSGMNTARFGYLSPIL